MYNLFFFMFNMLTLCLYDTQTTLILPYHQHIPSNGCRSSSGFSWKITVLWVVRLIQMLWFWYKRSEKSNKKVVVCTLFFCCELNYTITICASSCVLKRQPTFISSVPNISFGNVDKKKLKTILIYNFNSDPVGYTGFP